MFTTARSVPAAADRRALLALARTAIAERLGAFEQEAAHAPIFDTAAGAFVTVFVGGELRGCIGLTDAVQPLELTVRHCAVAAAFEDPRFLPVARGELDALAIEISVLSPLQPLDDVRSILIGRDGLVVERGRSRGLLLPQVAVAHDWSPVEFLQHTCLKAGLPQDAWRNGAALYRFQAEVFGDHDR